MKRGGRAVLASAAVVVALAAPGAAYAHAYLVKTIPAASVTLNRPPPAVALTFDEAVEPRFALISVRPSSQEGLHNRAGLVMRRHRCSPFRLLIERPGRRSTKIEMTTKMSMP